MAVSIAIISELADLDKFDNNNQAQAFLERARARYGMINLSLLRRTVEKNLAAYSQTRA